MNHKNIKYKENFQVQFLIKSEYYKGTSMYKYEYAYLKYEFYS